MKNKNTVLVTGSAGFIGFHLSKYLLNMGYHVVGIDNLNDYYDLKLKKERNKILNNYSDYNFHKLNIADYKLLKNIFIKYEFKTVFHLAAQAGVRYSLTNPFVYEESNLKGFLNILEAIRNYSQANLVCASSSSVYGNSTLPEKGFSENQKLSTPVSLYAATKQSNELLAYSYHHLYKIPVVCLRFFTVYGPWGRPDMAYFKFTKSILKEEPIKIFNQGKMKRDFTYIDDVVKGIVASSKVKNAYKIYNLGNSKPESLENFVNTIEELLNKKANKIYEKLQPGDMIETYANIDLAKEELDYLPKTNLKKGLTNFVEWFLKYYRYEIK